MPKFEKQLYASDAAYFSGSILVVQETIIYVVPPKRLKNENKVCEI